MSVDLNSIARFRDGVLKAHSLSASACETCECVHLEFHDAAGTVFASGSISLDRAMALATKIIEVRDFLVKRAGGAPRQ